MTKIDSFKAQVTTAETSFGGISKGEWSELSQALSSLTGADRDAAASWLQSSHPALAKSIGDGDYDGFTGAKSNITVPAGAALSAPVKAYLETLKSAGVELDLRGSGSTLGAAQMRKVMDTVGPAKMIDFVETMIIADNGLTFRLNDAGLREIGASMARGGVDAKTFKAFIDKNGAALGDLKAQLQQGYAPTMAGAVATAPSEITDIYKLTLAPDRSSLSIDPNQAPPGMRSRGISTTATAAGGLKITLDSGPFKSGEWKTASFRDLVKDPAQLKQLKDAGYDLDTKRPLLVVQGENDATPIVLALSHNANQPGLVAICKEVSVIEMGGKAMTVRKPVIYIYPTQKQAVSVRVEFDGEITVEYPKRRNGEWSMVALPDGTLFDAQSEKRYSYLFWEGERKTHFVIDKARASCVKAEDAEAFLDKACEAQGLNHKERTDFVSYWLPFVERNPFSLIQFLTPDECEAYAQLQVSPAPESMLRVFMIFQRTPEPIQTQAPVWPSVRRSGYTVVEWGGADLDEC